MLDLFKSLTAVLGLGASYGPVYGSPSGYTTVSSRAIHTYTPRLSSSSAGPSSHHLTSIAVSYGLTSSPAASSSSSSSSVHSIVHSSSSHHTASWSEQTVHLTSTHHAVSTLSLLRSSHSTPLPYTTSSSHKAFASVSSKHKSEHAVSSAQKSWHTVSSVSKSSHSVSSSQKSSSSISSTHKSLSDSSHAVPPAYKPSHSTSSLLKPSRSTHSSRKPLSSGSASQRPSSAPPRNAGCPAKSSIATVTTTTSTWTEATVATEFVNGTTTVLASETYITSTLDGTGLVYFNTFSKIFVTVTSIFTVSEAPVATVTVPLPAGFTPVACLPSFSNSIFTVTSVSTIMTTPYDFAATESYVGTVLTYVYTTYTTLTMTYPPQTSTVTASTTTTIVAPTASVYPACAANNIVNSFPDGTKFDLPFPRDGVFAPNPVRIASPYDCCVSCITDPNCYVALALQDFNVVFDTPPGSWVCSKYTPPRGTNITTCDPSFQAAELRPATSNWWNFTVSDGACGGFSIPV